MPAHVAIFPGLQLRAGNNLFTVVPGSQPDLWRVVSASGERREVTERFIRERFEVAS